MGKKWAVELTTIYLEDGTGPDGEPVSAGEVEIYLAPNDYANAEAAARAAVMRTGIYERRIINARPILREQE